MAAARFRLPNLPTRSASWFVVNRGWACCGLLMKSLQSVPSMDEVLEAASVFDQNGNGYISSEELRHVMKELGEGLDEDTLTQMIKVAEPDSEHQVKRKETIFFFSFCEPWGGDFSSQKPHRLVSAVDRSTFATLCRSSWAT